MEEYQFSVNEAALSFVRANKGSETSFHLPGDEIWTATVNFGNFNFQIYRGDGFQIWYNQYEIKKELNLFIRSTSPLLILHVALKGVFRYACSETGRTFSEGQYEMAYAPFVESRLDFRQPGNYESFSIYFEQNYLETYAGCSKHLEKLLQKVGCQKQISLFGQPRYLPLAIEDHIRAILTCSYHNGLAGRFIEGKVQESLIVLVHHLNLLDKLPEPDPVEASKAERARNMISDDLSRYDSVELLARKVHTTEAKLQNTFKQLYGTTVGKFSRELRLKKAHELLSITGSNRETLLSVALSVGYNDVGNFSTAFKQYFGYSPGTIYKRQKPSAKTN